MTNDEIVQVKCVGGPKDGAIVSSRRSKLLAAVQFPIAPERGVDQPTLCGFPVWEVAHYRLMRYVNGSMLYEFAPGLPGRANNLN